MRYRVRIASRAARDLESIHEFVGASQSSAASVWFAEFTEAIYSLEQYPHRGASVAENKKLRQLLFGQKPNSYRIIYRVDERNRLVWVVHLRHAAQRPLSTLDDIQS